MVPKVYVINRAQDEQRLADYAAAAAAHEVEFVRSPALDGHDPDAPLFLYRDLLRDSFWGSDQIKPGAFACALSHMAVWRRLIASGDDMALVTEDDGLFVQNPGRLYADARRLAEFDIIFANDRMAAWRDAGTVKSAAKLAPVAPLLARMAVRGLAPGENGLPKGPGADGYLISREGAERMCAHLEQVGIVAGIDWLMIQAALEDDDTPDCEEMRFLKGLPRAEPALRVYATSSPVVGRPEGRNPSVVNHKVETLIATLREAPEVQPIGGDGEGAEAKAPVGDTIDPVFAAFAEGVFYEKPALELMRRWMPQDGIFVDIGAHVGNHTIFMLRHGGAARALLFEFNQRAIDHLLIALEENGLTERVDDRWLTLGLGEERVKLEAAGSRKNISNNRLRPGFSETVPVRPGDSLLREFDVDFIKIDVNGDERAVLKGLKKTLKRKRPVVGVDISKPKSLKVKPYLERLGYVEVERAKWTEGEEARSFAIFTSSMPRRIPAIIAKAAAMTSEDGAEEPEGDAADAAVADAPTSKVADKTGDVAATDE